MQMDGIRCRCTQHTRRSRYTHDDVVYWKRRIRDRIRLEDFNLSLSESRYLTFDTVFVSEYLNYIFMMSISIIYYPIFFILSIFEFESGHKYKNKYNISPSDPFSSMQYSTAHRSKSPCRQRVRTPRPVRACMHPHGRRTDTGGDLFAGQALGSGYSVHRSSCSKAVFSCKFFFCKMTTSLLFNN
jgi:hypothetical protein